MLFKSLGLEPNLGKTMKTMYVVPCGKILRCTNLERTIFFKESTRSECPHTPKPLCSNVHFKTPGKTQAM